MAHIPDGVVSWPVLAGGWVIAGGGLALGLRRLTVSQIPAVALVSAVFFVAALVHFPVGPSSAHLILNGLAGCLLGWAAFPAIAVGLILQAILFGFGGVIVLGVNITTMAVPATICGLAFRFYGAGATGRRASFIGAGLGAASVALTAAAVAMALALSGRGFWPAAQLLIIAHVPVMIIEAVFTGAVLSLIARVQPEMLRAMWDRA